MWAGSGTQLHESSIYKVVAVGEELLGATGGDDGHWR